MRGKKEDYEYDLTIVSITHHYHPLSQIVVAHDEINLINCRHAQNIDMNTKKVVSCISVKWGSKIRIVVAVWTGQQIPQNPAWVECAFALTIDGATT